MSYVNLKELKTHLRIEHDAEDSYLVTLIDVAERAIERELQVPLASIVESNGGFLPTPLRQAVLIECGNLYENRESVAYATVNRVPRTLDYLLSSFKKYNNYTNFLIG